MSVFRCLGGTQQAWGWGAWGRRPPQAAASASQTASAALGAAVAWVRWAAAQRQDPRWMRPAAPERSLFAAKSHGLKSRGGWKAGAAQPPMPTPEAHKREKTLLSSYDATLAGQEASQVLLLFLGGSQPARYASAHSWRRLRGGAYRSAGGARSHSTCSQKETRVTRELEGRRRLAGPTRGDS